MGLRARSLPGLALAAFGCTAAYRGIRALYGVGPESCANRSHERPDPIVERHTVDESSWESFSRQRPTVGLTLHCMRKLATSGEQLVGKV